MNTKSAFLAITTAALLTACGGGSGDGGGSNTSAGETIPATKGMFVSRVNFFITTERYWQVVLEGGETWIVKEFNARGEPIFFATGKFKFTDRVGTTTSGSGTTTTATVTTTPERTVTETNTVTTNPSAAGVLVGNTHFKANDALISINSNILATSEVTYSEPYQSDVPLAGSARVLTPEVGRTFAAGARRGLDAGSPFAYDRPANVQRLAGAYTFAFNLTRTNMVVSGNGAFSGTNEVTGCAFTGTLAPHPSGKNVFAANLAVTNCQDAGSYSGIASAYPQPDLNTGNGSSDLISESGEMVPAIFLAAVNSSNSRVFSVAMFRD